MKKKVYKRNELNVSDTWDLTRLFKTEKEYEKALEELVILSEKFKEKYQNKIKDFKDINQSIDEFKLIMEKFYHVNAYQSLHISVDQTNLTNIKRSGNYDLKESYIKSLLTFFESELEELDEKILLEAANKNVENNHFIKNIIDAKKHKIDGNIKQALSEFSNVLNSSYSMYANIKFADMKFENFEVDGKSFPNSFSMFENEWAHEVDQNIRRKSFESFYNKIKDYENALAYNYNIHVLKEKAYSKLQKFDSVFDYLLFNQKVDRSLYNRQIDLIVKHLSKPMQKFAKLIKDIYKLDKMTYADLNLSIDHEFEPLVTIDEAKEYCLKALNIYGDEYLKIVKDSFDQRWIDFPQNLGKSTGGFCSTPYKKGSYILLNWNGKMDEVFVLAHELGHAGHFNLADFNQNILNVEPSLYFIEAPSTMNELIMADYLKGQKQDLRFKRWVLATMISRTYYHNFVTHLLEASFQRRVYEHVDNNIPLSANVLNKLMIETLKEFWGDSVEIPDYAGLTWARQPHYFMGLYSYTYSAGLTIATLAFDKIKNKKININSWLDILKSGGTKSPFELAKMVDVDLNNEDALLKTIKIISNMIDEIAEITNKLNNL